MKKNIRLISMITILLYVLMLFPSLFVFAANDNEAYKAGYSNGLWEGIDAAYSDLEDLKPKNYYKVMPKDPDIVSMYDLDKETASYRTSFIRGFKDGFREGYNTTYDNPKIEAKPTNYDEALGYEMGKVSGFNDYYAGKANKWASGVPNTTKLIEMFQLSKEPNAYKNSFITKFKQKYQEGYEFGYRYAKFEPMKNDIQRGEKDGELIGGLLGSNYGRKDYFDKNNNRWDRNLPSDNDIKNTFLLSNEALDYQKSFIASFKKAYRDKYNEAYRNANLEYFSYLFQNGYEQGKEIGFIRGSDYAKVDFMQGKSNNSERYKYTDDKIIFEYNLFNENKRFMDGFIAGFREGLNNGYTLSYREASFDELDSKLLVKTIPIGGGEVLSGDSKLKIAIDKGTFYNNVAVSIDKYMQAKNSITLLDYNRYTKNSDLYIIKINNPMEKCDNDKSVKISFEYYGGQKGGIYKFDNGKWHYVYTLITENAITAYVSPKSLQSNAIYGVFIDEKAFNPLDIRGHWAKNDIITSLRRNITGLYSDGYFNGDLPLSRIQLLMYLNNAYKWQLNLTDKDMEIVEGLKDYKSIESVKELVAYGIKHNYIRIGEDNSFNLYAPVSYSQLENIMKKVADNGFTWKWVADKMVINRDKLSSSYISMGKSVTRAEFCYMINLLTQ